MAIPERAKREGATGFDDAGRVQELPESQPPPALHGHTHYPNFDPTRIPVMEDGVPEPPQWWLNFIGAPITQNPLLHAYDIPLSSGIWTIDRTWAVMGEITVRAYPGLFIHLPAGQTMKLTRCRYKITSGTSATMKLQINGVDATGFTALSVTTTAATTNPTDIVLADNDYIELSATAVSAAPTDLSFSIFVEITVA